jgi:hypothetical protein
MSSVIGKKKKIYADLCISYGKAVLELHILWKISLKRTKETLDAVE